MQKQHGVYCSRDEWVGVMAAISRGIVAMEEDAKDGDELAKKLFPWTTTACSSLNERVMREMGMADIYRAWSEGDHEKAKELAAKHADDTE